MKNSNNMKALLKSFEQVRADSDYVEKNTTRSVEAWKVWHPHGKNLTVTEADLHLFGNEVTVSLRDTKINRNKEVKTIYNVFYKGRMLTAYDYWFVWIDNEERYMLEEDLFEI